MIGVDFVVLMLIVCCQVKGFMTINSLEKGYVASRA